MAAHTFVAAANKDGTATVLGIVTGRSATGSAVIDQHGHNIGYAVKQADVSSISFVVTDTSTLPETQTLSGNLTVSAAISDTVQHGGIWWADPSTGYNFTHDLLPAAFPNRARTYRVAYKFTMGDGSVGAAEVLLTT